MAQERMTHERFNHRSLTHRTTQHAVLLRVMLAALLAAALLLAQWAALTHAVEHAPPAPGLQAQPQAYPQQLHPHDHGALAEANNSVWGHDAGTPDCQRLEQLLTSQLPGFCQAALPRVWPLSPPVERAQAPDRRSAELRAYQARGPPRA